MARDLAHAAELSDRVAPEHLEICTADPDAVAANIRHAGAIFLGYVSIPIAVLLGVVR